MLRKIVFVLIALAIPLVASSAASAEQYPPTGDAPAPTTAAPAPSSGAEGAPLARTGTSTTPLVLGAVVLLAGGAVVMVASRRRIAPTA